MPLCITFDNLGEAAELELGAWPAGRAIGRHPSVTHALPRILDRLGELRATFFVEAWNATVYPDALREIAARGHEIALHGWRHERWAVLSPEREAELLTRSLAALAELSIAPRGFRPPGGVLAKGSAGSLAERGFRYASPAADEAPPVAPLAALPFAWPEVDAYHLERALQPLRRRRGDGDTPGSTEPWREALAGALARGGDRVVIFHPYLLVRDEAFAVLADFLDELRERDDLRLPTCDGLADWRAAGHGVSSGERRRA